MNLPDLKGLRFPDEFVIKFFYKAGCHQCPGRVLELGCGNGNNLLLFHEYGWQVVGVDICADSLADAEHNFTLADAAPARHKFIQRDLCAGLGELATGPFDVILLPSVLYYIPRLAAINVLRELRSRAAPGSLLFSRNRSLRDYRYMRGEEIEPNGFCLTETATGEAGLLNVFYDEWEIVDMLRESLQLRMDRAEVLHVESHNPQQGARVVNSDIVIWGRTGL